MGPVPTARPPSCHAPACAAGTQALGLSGTDLGIWVLQASLWPPPRIHRLFLQSPQPCPESCAESTGSSFKCKNQSLSSPVGNGHQGEEPREEHGAHL